MVDMEYSLLQKYMESPEKLGDESLPVLKKLTDEYPYFQAAWILYLKNLKNLDHSDFQGELNRAAIRIADRKRLFNFLNQAHRKTETESLIAGSAFHPLDFFADAQPPDGLKMKGADLIDSFITSLPSLKMKAPVANEEYDISEESVSENDGIVTETYANILFQQKKYQQAIKCFEKLSLKFPEKNIYFAARIEEITKILNNN